MDIETGLQSPPLTRELSLPPTEKPRREIDPWAEHTTPSRISEQGRVPVPAVCAFPESRPLFKKPEKRDGVKRTVHAKTMDEKRRLADKRKAGDQLTREKAEKDEREEAKEKKGPKSIDVLDFQRGFEAAKRGAEAFIDKTLKEEFQKAFTEQKVELKNWKPIMDALHHYNVALAHLYLTKTLEILSLEEGTRLEVKPDKEPEKDIEKMSLGL